MTPEFTNAAAPLLIAILDLAKRAANGQARQADVERAAMLAAFESAVAKTRGPRGEEWALASYALAALVDDLMIVEIPWAGRTWWENHAIEVELFGTRRRATEFFDRAAKAATLPEKDAATLYAAAVVMGFRGVLRDKPEALDAWMRSNVPSLRISEGRPKTPALAHGLPGATPLPHAVGLIWHALVTTALVAMLAVTCWWAWVIS
jgi:type IV/VI secretion system ImpK/VasF family protein